jgi:hypothetical protein
MASSSSSSGWTGGEAGWEPGRGLWLRSAQGTFAYGKDEMGWRVALRMQLAASWLWLRQAPAAAHVLRDVCLSKGFPYEGRPPLAVAFAQRDSLCELYQALACRALDEASEAERRAAALALR